MNLKNRAATTLSFALISILLGVGARADVHDEPLDCPEGTHHVRANGRGTCEADRPAPRPICDPATQPSPNWGVKGGQCLKSCGFLGGPTATSPHRSCSALRLESAGNAYDAPNCCLPCPYRALSRDVQACYDGLAESAEDTAGKCASAGTVLASELNKEAAKLAEFYKKPALAAPGHFFTMQGCRDTTVFYGDGDMAAILGGNTPAGTGAGACIADGRLCGVIMAECGADYKSYDDCFRCCNGVNGHTMGTDTCPNTNTSDPKYMTGHWPHMQIYGCTATTATHGPVPH